MINATKTIKMLFIALLFISCSSGYGNPPRVVLLIGDGMGPEQIRAAEYYNGQPFAIKDSAIFSGSLSTLNYSGGVTDSAAGATAIATGNKVDNGVISMKMPGTGESLKTVFEYARDKKYKTGLLTTSYILDATPAAFIAHSSTRSDYTLIAANLFSFKPDIVMGGLKHLSVAQFQNAGYSAYNSIESYDKRIRPFLFIKLSDDIVPYEYAGYASGGIYPRILSSASAIAFNNLPAYKSFILMIEGGRIDHAGHSGLIRENIFETNEFFYTAMLIYRRLVERGNYLMIITADHETGGLNVIKDNGKGNFPDIEWSAGSLGYYSHTNREVPVFIYSDTLTKENASTVKDNTDIFKLIKSFID